MIGWKRDGMIGGWMHDYTAVMRFDYDLVVVGAGSGGVRAARWAAMRGMHVAVVEAGALGGTCVNVGCIPKKLFFYASRFAKDFSHATGFGWAATTPAFEWPTLMRNKNAEIERLHSVYAGLLDDAGAVRIGGLARLIDAHTVAVGDKMLSTRHILIATGSRPRIPPITGHEHLLVSDDIFFLETLPESIVIWGGGYIAVEFAGIFNGLGVDTTLVYRKPLLLKGFDHEIAAFLSAEMRKNGITLKASATLTAVHPSGGRLSAALADGDALTAEAILCATGRAPNTAALNVAAAGVQLDQDGAVVVDHRHQTNVPSIYAIGDVTNRVNLTPVAVAEAMAVVAVLSGDDVVPLDYDTIPTCVFSQPNVGTVGFTEEAAREAGYRLSVYRTSFTPLAHSLSGEADAGLALVKLVVDCDSDRILGAHLVGDDAGEIMQGIAIAIKAGATKTDFDHTLGIHPTTAEEFVSLRDAAR